MKFRKLPILFFQLIILLSLAFFLQGCKPILRGANQTFVTNGSADDGDDQTTGPVKKYANPTRSIKDGPAEAISDPESFKSLRGIVTAETGLKPIRVSSSKSSNKVTSTFVVYITGVYQFVLSSTASATLTNGVGGYLVFAQVLDKNGMYVKGTYFKKRYDFKENPNGQLDVFEDSNEYTQITNGGIISPTDTGPKFVLL